MMFADELFSIWEHDRQVFIFETWRGSMGLQTVLSIFEFSIRFLRYCSHDQQFMFTKLGDLGEKRHQKMERRSNFKNPHHCFGNKVVMSKFAKLALSSYLVLRSVLEKDQRTWLERQPVSQPCTETQCKWATSMASVINFRLNSVTQNINQSWPKWSDQNIDSSKKQFWPFSCALRNRR